MNATSGSLQQHWLLMRFCNNAATFRWNHLFNKRLFLNTTLYASAYDYALHTDLANNTKWSTRIANFSLKTDFSYFIKPNNILSFGLGLGGHNFNPGNFSSDFTAAQFPVTSIRNTTEFVLYGNHEVKFNDHWGLNYGLRLTTWSNQGEAFEFVFDENRIPVDTLFYKQ